MWRAANPKAGRPDFGAGCLLCVELIIFATGFRAAKEAAQRHCVTKHSASAPLLASPANPEVGSALGDAHLRRRRRTILPLHGAPASAQAVQVLQVVQVIQAPQAVPQLAPAYLASFSSSASVSEIPNSLARLMDPNATSPRVVTFSFALRPLADQVA